jgi:plastocyanin
MRRFIALGTVVAVGLGLWGCSGSSDSDGGNTPTSPTPPSTSDTVTIDIVRTNGEQSFSPNPATVPDGRMVVWHNVDNTAHRVVLDDRSVDTGNLAPGASSQPRAIGSASGGPYHCTIHPEMVGRIVR